MLRRTDKSAFVGTHWSRSHLVLVAFVAIVFPAATNAGPMTTELKMLQPQGRGLRTLFEMYGYQPGHSIYCQANEIRFWVPTGTKETGQTGLFSFFALAGDCEVIMTYEIVKLETPQSGYGSGIGLAFDIEGDRGRAKIQRVNKGEKGNGYLLSSGLRVGGRKLQPTEKFVPVSVQAGRMGMRRNKTEIVFLATETFGGQLNELARMEFTDLTIRKMRVFADCGGSSTAIDARVRQIDVRGDEITAGVPVIRARSNSLWWLGAPSAALLMYCLQRWWRRVENKGSRGPQRESAATRR